MVVYADVVSLDEGVFLLSISVYMPFIVTKIDIHLKRNSVSEHNCIIKTKE